MSTPVTDAADSNLTPELAHVVQPVSVIYDDDRIGSGQLVTTSSRITVTGHYQWPRDAPAEVRFSFDFIILTATACTVEVDWPGLLPLIEKTPASYNMLLLSARPDFVIRPPTGEQITAVFLGPLHIPEITTALQVGVGRPNETAAVTLLFRYEHIA